MAKPNYLTGDKAGIEAFIDKFDVCWCLAAMRLDSADYLIDLSVRLRWYAPSALTLILSAR